MQTLKDEVRNNIIEAARRILVNGYSDSSLQTS